MNKRNLGILAIVVAWIAAMIALVKIGKSFADK